jgi:hypothetical protein
MSTVMKRALDKSSSGSFAEIRRVSVYKMDVVLRDKRGAVARRRLWRPIQSTRFDVLIISNVLDKAYAPLPSSWRGFADHGAV